MLKEYERKLKSQSDATLPKNLDMLLKPKQQTT